MRNNIAGPGQGLQLPQYLYPSELYNAPYDFSNNYQTLSPGDAIPVPAGTWFLQVGAYSCLQYLDPVTATWRMVDSVRGQPFWFQSDGFNFRIANLTGCPVAAVVAGGGSSFAASTATITASTGGSTWQAIVGGSLSVSTVSAVGANYTMPPLVFIPAPPSPGIQATARANIANGTVASVSLVNFGAGYTSAPTALILPNPTDPNFGTITQATVVLVLNAANSGAITGALCTNSGASLATISSLSLTAAGGSGTGATITPVVLQTVASTSIVAAGAGMGSVSNPALIGSVGGQPASTSAIVNPAVELTAYRPRPYQASGTCNSLGAISGVGTVYDSGLFVGTPTAVVTPGASGLALTSVATVASIAFTMGASIDTILLQPI